MQTNKSQLIHVASTCNVRCGAEIYKVFSNPSCLFILTHLQVLKYCPKDLQADICVHLNRVILENNVAFRDANTGVKRAIARNFWISHVAPGDRIIHHGESLDVLYFIARGSLEVKQGESVVGLLGEKKVIKSRHFLILLYSSEIVFVMYAILNSHCLIEKKKAFENFISEYVLRKVNPQTPFFQIVEDETYVFSNTK